MEPSDETASTSSSAGWPAPSIAPRICGRRLVTPVDVSLWTTSTARMRWSRSWLSLASSAAGSTPCRQSPGTTSTSSPSRRATSAHPLRELSDVEGEHAIPGRQRVDERRFPRAGAGGGEHHDRLRGLEDTLQPVEHGPAERRELRAPVIDGRLRHRAEHAIRRVGGTGNLEKVAAAPMHGRRSYRTVSCDDWRGLTAPARSEDLPGSSDHPLLPGAGAFRPRRCCELADRL